MAIGIPGMSWMGRNRGASANGSHASDAKQAAAAAAEDGAMAAVSEEPLLSGDPTQRLLTSLGRFQRQVAGAQGGHARDGWSDECMQQLINAIEIAIAQEWSDLREALTDAARILQTYEDAGQVHLCLGFLADSYEILCLMVGDLIVGNVRSGVVQKWRERYEQAVATVTRDGLTLVEDDNADSPRPPAHAPAPEMSEFDVALDAAIDFNSEEARALDPFGDPHAAAVHAPAEEMSPFDMPAHLDARVDTPGNLPSLDEIIAETPAAQDEAPEFHDDAKEFIQPDAPMAAPPAPAEEHIEATFEEIPPTIEESPLVMEKSPAFEEIPRPAAPEPAPEPMPAAAPEAQGNTPESLMLNAQEAMKSGRLADAKHMMLQLAAEMARLETAQAASTVESLEQRIREDERHIAEAQEAVAHCEKSVQDNEWLVREREGEVEKQRTQSQGLRDRFNEIEAAIADLDAKIRALQDQRRAEEQNLAEAEAALTQCEAEELDAQGDLEALRQAEGKSRESLEAARRRVVEFRTQLDAHTAEIQSARADLRKRSAAVQEIEQTFGGGKAKTDELF